MENLTPVFVYGTLRHGEGNYHILRGKTEKEEIALISGAIYPVASYGGFPCLMDEEGEVVGELMWIKPELYERTMQALDRLEGYREYDEKNSMYIRQKVSVMYRGEEIQAWAYFWNRGKTGTKKITSGCWKTFEQQRRASQEEYLDEMYNDDYNHL